MKPGLSQFIRYLLCGGTGALTDYLLFIAATAAGVHYQVANGAGYATGTLISFFLNRSVTFKVRDRVGGRLAMFCAVAGVGYAASAVALWALIDGAGLDGAIAKAATLPAVAVLQFSLNRWITFRTASHETV
jgi:putative flippase GtrA